MGMLKRTANGYFTTLPIDLGEERDGLCNTCGFEACVMRKIVQRAEVNRYEAIVAIRSCKTYQPIFDFRDTAGMETQFNTFRLGGAWMDRVKEGDLIALRGPDKAIFGHARITAVHCGPFSTMNQLYGDDNHLAIKAAVDGRKFDMVKVMRNCYGTTRFNEDRMTSVLYMERLSDG